MQARLCDSIKLLGVDINRKLDNVDDIFLGIGEKILNLILFWSRFKLTLSGRISIIKTLLVPQINYPGCFLTPSRAVLEGLQSLLDDFALNGIRFAKDRLYIPPDKGGLGLIHLGTFLMAQKCSWIKRTHAMVIDNWRYNLKKLAPNGDISLIRLCDVDMYRNPILFKIVEGFETFVKCYGKLGLNTKLTPIFCNPFITRNKSDSHLVDIGFFGKQFYEKNRNAIRTLTFNDCFNGDSFKSLEQFRNFGLPLSYALWMRLRSAILLAKKKLASVESAIRENGTGNLIPEPQSINTFLGKLSKGSKKFRSVIDRSVYNDIDITDNGCIKTLCAITLLEIPNKRLCEAYIKSWNLSYLDNNLKEFLFKSRFNAIRTGDRLSHVSKNVDQRCFMCTCLNSNSTTRETFYHFFRKCPVTSNLLSLFNARLGLNWVDCDSIIFDNVYWMGNFRGEFDGLALLVYDIFRYLIWSSKLKKIFPRIEILLSGFSSILGTAIAVKPGLRAALLRNNNISNILQVLD